MSATHGREKVSKILRKMGLLDPIFVTRKRLRFQRMVDMSKSQELCTILIECSISAGLPAAGSFHERIWPRSVAS